MVQEHPGPSLSFLVPPRHRIDVGRGPSLSSPVLSQLCKDHLAAWSGTTRAQMPTPAGLCCLHTLEPSSTLHRALRVVALTPLVTLRTVKCPTQGLENTWSQGVHPRAAGATQPLSQTTLCKALQTQKQSLAQKALLRLKSCLQREEPENSSRRDAREQESLGISPHITPQRHALVILLAPPDHKGNPVPLNGSLLFARAPRSLKHSKKAQKLLE